jgi:hypothetical protein
VRPSRIPGRLLRDTFEGHATLAVSLIQNITTLSRESPESLARVSRHSRKSLPTFSRESPDTLARISRHSRKSLPSLSRESPDILARVSRHSRENLPTLSRESPESLARVSRVFRGIPERLLRDPGEDQSRSRFAFLTAPHPTELNRDRHSETCGPRQPGPRDSQWRPSRNTLRGSSTREQRGASARLQPRERRTARRPLLAVVSPRCSPLLKLVEGRDLGAPSLAYRSEVRNAPRHTTRTLADK